MYINQKKTIPAAKPFIPSAKFKEFVKQNPECVKQSNQFGFLPLHCTLDKTRPNALVVEYLVEAFPDARVV